jgi:hypothetical protein
MSKVQYPVEVPVLTGKDFCKGDFKSGRKKCSSEWLYTVFGNVPYNSKLYRKLRKKLIEQRRQKCIPSYILIPCLNDAPDMTLEQLAIAWNRFTAELGYTEGNPEA